MSDRVVDPKFEEGLLSSLKKGKPRVVAKQIETHLSTGGTIQNRELLKQIIEPSGMTVAHLMALKGIEMNDPEVLSLKGKDRSALSAAFGHNGCSVAYILANKGFRFDDPEILKLGSEDGRSTVAHAMAKNGHVIQNKEILTLRDDQGVTVAHIMASKGFKFQDPEILSLKTVHGFTVQAFQES